MADPMNTSRIQRVLDLTRRWIEEAIIGLNLCPFAASVYRDGEVRLVVSQAESTEGAVRDALEEAAVLLEASERATTLVIFPRALDQFDVFLDAAASLEEGLSGASADGILQVATFHPEYRFEGAGEKDPGNFTNRSPFPIFHLLQERQVTEAVERHPDPEGIPEANIDRLESLGGERVREIWSEWLPEGDH